MNSNDKLSRNDLQTEALHTLAQHRRLILNWGTGVGKSRVAVNAMDYILAKHPDSRFLLVVQETNHKLNWRIEFRDAKGERRAEEILSHTEVECYASLDKYRGTSWTLIVFDEGHHLRSDLKQDIISTMKADRVLLLSATLNDQGDGDDLVRTLYRTFGQFQQLTFGTQDAIDNDILGVPDINLIPIVLTPEEREKYDSLTDNLNKKKSEYFNARFEAGLESTDDDTEETEEVKGKWLYAGGLRKRFLGAKKTRVAGMILRNILRGRKYICFCASVKQVEWLRGENYICSKKTKKENTAVIEAFNAGEIRSIYAVGMLQEGQNLAGIEAGLLIQLDGKERSFVQKFGRVLRSKTPVLYLLYVADSRDEDYLQNALRGINKEYVHKWAPLMTDGTPAPELLERADDRPSVLDFRTPGMKVSRSGEAVFEVDQQNGVFRSRGVTTTDLSGRFTDISVSESPFPSYTFHLAGESGNCSITLHKKLSIGLLAVLSSAPDCKGKQLAISVKNERGFAQYRLRLDGAPLSWNDDFKLPPAPNGDYTARYRYLDGIANSLNRTTITNG